MLIFYNFLRKNKKKRHHIQKYFLWEVTNYFGETDEQCLGGEERGLYDWKKWMRVAKLNKKHCRVDMWGRGGGENINKDAAVDVFKFAWYKWHLGKGETRSSKNLVSKAEGNSLLFYLERPKAFYMPFCPGIFLSQFYPRYWKRSRLSSEQSNLSGSIVSVVSNFPSKSIKSGSFSLTTTLYREERMLLNPELNMMPLSLELNVKQIPTESF